MRSRGHKEIADFVGYTSGKRTLVLSHVVGAEQRLSVSLPLSLFRAVGQKTSFLAA